MRSDLRDQSSDLRPQKSIYKIKSYSKINLGLWVKEKRQDGFHEIETIFYECKDLFDEVEIYYNESKEKNIKISFLQADLNKSILEKENLAYKTSNLFFEKTKLTGNLKITIDKKIPLQAGLGGGSSNAASILKELNKIFNNVLSESELLEIASQIGSDVPFFVIGGTCIGKGRGEVLEKIENKLSLNIKIVKLENTSVSTKWAYDEIDKRKDLSSHAIHMKNILEALKTSNRELLFKNLFNDFEEVVFEKYPELLVEKEKLLRNGYGAVLLCGSGSAICGLK